MPRAGSIKERHSRRDGTGGKEVVGMDDDDDEDDIADDMSPSNSTSVEEDSSKEVRLSALPLSPITTTGTCWSSRGAAVASVLLSAA